MKIINKISNGSRHFLVFVLELKFTLMRDFKN